MSTLKNNINTLITSTVESLGYSIVDINIIGNKSITLQIMIERQDGVYISIDDCAKFSRAVSAILDVEDVFKDRYTLEVSSAGIDRPLLKIEDYDRFKNNYVNLKTKVGIDNQKQFNGYLLGIKEDTIILRIEDKNKEIEIKYENISKANLDIVGRENSDKPRSKNAKSK